MRKYQGKTNNTGVGFQPLGVRNVLEERQKKAPMLTSLGLGPEKVKRKMEEDECVKRRLAATGAYGRF